MKVYGYISVVFPVQGYRGGQCVQQHEITAYCNQKKHELITLYNDDCGNGNNILTTKFQSMIKDMLLNDIDTVVIDSLDRLSSQKPLQDYIICYLASKNINLITVAGNLVVTKNIQNNPLTKTMVLLQCQFAELDRSLNMIKLRRAREEVRMKRGKCEGRKSYKEFAPDLIKQIKKLRRKRMGRRPQTYADIAKKLNESGYLTASGTQFTGNNVSVILHRLKAA